MASSKQSVSHAQTAAPQAVRQPVKTETIATEQQSGEITTQSGSPQLAQPLTPQSLLQLQRTIGNRAVTHLIQPVQAGSRSQTVIQRIAFSKKVKGKLDEAYRELDDDVVKDFVEWCVSEAQAMAISRDFSFDDWENKIQPLSPNNKATKTFALTDAGEIGEAIERYKVDERNRKAREAAAASASVVNYDDAARDYTPPGEPLQLALIALGVDLARIKKVHNLTAQKLLAEDLKHEKARWEMEQNGAKLAGEARTSRTTAMKDAKAAIATIIEEYKPLEAEFKKEETKQAEIAAKIVEVEALQPVAFTGNALCMELWTLAKHWAGSGGKYELVNGYTAGELRGAWQAWQPFQNAVAAVADFATHRIGNGTAQDKSSRPDIKTRRHTSQMNFSVTWKGVEQMIHVGLAGTENPGFTG